MSYNILSLIPSLQDLHSLIKKDPVSGSLKAEKKLVENIQAVAEKIYEEAEKVFAQVKSDAQSAVKKLMQETASAVKKITKDSTKMAEDLISDTKGAGGKSKKDNAWAAVNILQTSQKTIDKLNESVKKSVSRINEEATKATSKVKNTIDAASKDLAKIEKETIERISKAREKAALQLAASTNGGDQSEAGAKKAKEAAEIIKDLGLAAEKVKQGAVKANAQLQKASEEAVRSVQMTVFKEVKLVNASIQSADKIILKTATTAIELTVGKEEATIFDVALLKKRWNRD